MNYLNKIPTNLLYKPCSDNIFSHKSNDIHHFSQKRAAEAIKLALYVNHEGYNIFAMGETGVGKTFFIKQLLEKHKPTFTIYDHGYLHNFCNPSNPIAVKVEAGSIHHLKKDIKNLFEQLNTSIQIAFSKEKYNNKIMVLKNKFEDEKHAKFSKLAQKAQEKNFIIDKSEKGFSILPAKNNEILSPKELLALPKSQQQQLNKDGAAIQAKLENILLKLSIAEKIQIEEIEKYKKKILSKSTNPIISKFRNKWGKETNLSLYIDGIQDFIIKNYELFLESDLDQENDEKEKTSPTNSYSLRKLFNVNVISEHPNKKNATFPYSIAKSNSLTKIFGRIEYTSKLGTSKTNYMKIKPGYLHKVNGGCLVIDAQTLLEVPGLWFNIKQALKNKKIDYTTTDSPPNNCKSLLDPMPMDLDIKIILVGSARLYNIMFAEDREFQSLFRIVAEFDDIVPYNLENALVYKQIITKATNSKYIKPVTKQGVKKCIEIGAKIAGSQEYITTNASKIISILNEANYLARNDNNITEVHLTKAYQLQKQRVSDFSNYLERNIKNKSLLINTNGTLKGQINALSVVQINEFLYGQPQRITVSVYQGKEGVINIEKSVNLSGSIHSKSVLILQSFLNSKFAKEKPLSFSASVVFEQSYGGIDGDSATCAETLALLSALSGIPIKQSLAITGSMDQMGNIQPVGSVNTKITAFYEICKLKGFSEGNGVVIPKSNLKDLMLDEEIRQSCDKGEFSIYAVENISEAIELFMDKKAGKINGDNSYTKDSVYESIMLSWVK